VGNLDDKVEAALKQLEGPPCLGCGGELRLVRHRENCPVKVVRAELERLEERLDDISSNAEDRDLYR